MLRIVLVDPSKGVFSDENAVVHFSSDQRIFVCETGEEALAISGKIQPQIIFADLNLPDMDGITLCKELKSFKGLEGLFFIALTEKPEGFVQSFGFESGVDEFIVKPLTRRILTLKIAALKRRLQNPRTRDRSGKTELIIDVEKFEVISNGSAVQLPKKEFEILLAISEKEGEAITRDELIEKVWKKRSREVNPRTLDVHIKNIRKAIGNDRIKTIKGFGYKMS